MKFTGKVWKFGDDIDTDVIIPARFLSSTDPAFLGQHCMEAIDPEFSKKVSKGDIIVAGKNFGCGSSREHAPVAIKGAGISCVIARGFARIFFRNAINTGLPVITAPEAADIVQEGDNLEVDPVKGIITLSGRAKQFRISPYPEFIQKIIVSGGLMNYIISGREF
ncbi:MAG TPA: 3-isopropylmalate dehydratase small subunit [bacterium]